MSTLTFFRDTLSLGPDLLTLLATSNVVPKPGDTLVIGARTCTISSLPADFNYTIAADKLSLISGSSLTLTGTATNPSPIVSVFAVEIDGPFDLICAGMDGAPGAPGAHGTNGEVIVINGKPRLLPPEPGGPGGNGGSGASGGMATIHYSTANRLPTASAPGGHGGRGGNGGKGGKAARGTGSAPDGSNGRSGADGAAGIATVAQVQPTELWGPLGPAIAGAWAKFRTTMGGYLFRRFDPASRALALVEFSAALVLDPANVDAQTLLDRVLHQQTPTGLSRDIDISPDYKDLSASLPTEAGLVQNAFVAIHLDAAIEVNASATRDQLVILSQQLADREAEAKDNVMLAGGDARIADVQLQQLNDQMIELDRKIDQVKNEPFSLEDFATDVGTIGAAVAGIASGAGAIVSIAEGIAAFNSLAHGQNSDDSTFVYDGVLELLTTKAAGKDIGSVVSNLGSVIKGGKGLLSFSDTVSKLGSNSSKLAPLLKEQAEVAQRILVAKLQSKQALDRVTAAQRQAQNLATEARAVNDLIGQWSNTSDFLNQGIEVLITAARQLVDIVAEDVFLARRALEIYELDDASDVRFDYGYLHPDLDTSLPPLQRVQMCLQSVVGLAVDVLTWHDIFQRLNVAQARGFDVVHPALEVDITDPTALAALRTNQGLQFTIDTSMSPPGIFELKVNGLTLELDGASATVLSLVWIEHSGHWWMIKRPVPGSSPTVPVKFTLFPHAETFNFGAGQNIITAVIPAQPQSSSEPGPPFAFWGRGVLADWRIFLDPSATKLDLTKLTALRLTIQCIGLAAQGTSTLSVTRVAPPIATVPFQLPEKTTPVP